MTMFRMPISTRNILATMVLILLAFPVLTAALFGLLADRRLGMHIVDPANGGVILWQHMFWFFGHPEVYIVALPYFGIVTEIFPVFSRRPTFGYKGLVFATLAIAALSAAVWAHHMFATGAVLLPFFRPRCTRRWRRRLSNDEAARVKHEHAEAEETMKRLEGLQADDAAFDAELTTLMREIRAHVKEEEGEIFPNMRTNFSEDELVELGMKVASIKQMAPTRPHPAAPDSPLGDRSSAR